MTMDEINAFVADPNKALVGEIDWISLRGRVARYQFREEIQHSSQSVVRVYLNLWVNPNFPKITLAYYVDGPGRIYGWCLGVAHDGMDFHQHQGTRGNETVTPLPDNIARLVNNPRAAWIAFCHRSSLTHTGRFTSPTRLPWSTQQQI